MAEVKDDNVKEFNSRWLSDGIGEDYKEWGRFSKNKLSRVYPNSVFIESPTGTGKTYFITNVLFPYAAKMHRHILYLGNRTALKEQLISNLKKEYNTDVYTTASRNYDYIQYPGSFYGITILNYQSFLSFIKETDAYLLTEHFYYVILDECHFFLEDSNFNSMTSLIYEKIFLTFLRSVIVFLSATIEEIRPFMENSLHMVHFLANTQSLYSTFDRFILRYRNKYCHRAYNLFFL